MKNRFAACAATFSCVAMVLLLVEAAARTPSYHYLQGSPLLTSPRPGQLSR